MNKLFSVFFAVLAFTTSAQAAVVYDGYPAGPGGLSTPYPAGTPEVYAGLIEMTYAGSPLLLMFDDYSTRIPVGFSGNATIYTYNDVQNGAPVKFTPAQYARAGYILYLSLPAQVMSASSLSLRQYAELIGNNTLASTNTQVWEITSSIACPSFWRVTRCSQIDLFNWDQTMYVVKFTNQSGLTDEALIPRGGQNVTVANTPVPPAFWLLGSGLLGLVGVARRNGERKK